MILIVMTHWWKIKYDKESTTLEDYLPILEISSKKEFQYNTTWESKINDFIGRLCIMYQTFEPQWIEDCGVGRIDISIEKNATETNDDDSSREYFW